MGKFLHHRWIVGGAFIGLQFVVITLLADRPITGGDKQAANAFTTPGIIHFGVVLLLSAIVSAPWIGLGVVPVLFGFQCRPIGNMRKTLDFIGDLKLGGCFKWHTPSHSVQKCQKAFIFTTVSVNPGLNAGMEGVR